MKCLKHLNFIYYFFIIVIIYIYFFFLSWQLGMMDNLAGWRQGQGCMRFVGYLRDRSYQPLNKNARVDLYIHKAKLCICFDRFLVHLVSQWDQGALSVGVVVRVGIS